MHHFLRNQALRTFTGVTVGCAAALATASSPASAISAIPAIYGGETAILHEIGDKRRHGNGYRHHHHHHHHHYGYAPYRPYYGYRYWPEYYYGGYSYPPPYWARPGVSVGFSF